METVIKDLNSILDYSTIEKKRNADILGKMQLLELKVSEAVDFLNLMGYFSNKVVFKNPLIIITGSKPEQQVADFNYSVEFSSLPHVISNSRKKYLCRTEKQILEQAIK